MSSNLPQALLNQLVQTGTIGAFDAVMPLSGGRTNRVWRFRDAGETLVLKLFAPPARSPLFPNDPDAECAVLEHLGGARLAPDLRATGTSGQGRWLLYSHLPGKLWTESADAVGEGLARLHAHPPPERLRLAPNGSAALIAQTHAILDTCSGRAAADLRTCQPVTPAVPPTTPRLLHGDPVPANILIHDGQARFIDWQCPALGDPCEDLAIFASPAMQLLYGGAPLTQSDLAALKAGYADASTTDRFDTLRSLYHWRMAAFCLWRTEQGDLEYAQGFELERAALSAPSEVP
ncbi:phosphotransferase family protein [Aestuariivita boseongensis]|uniref:phosphotransferase family protein n=1 Tax=Aestuariivita boseongensis TaxID=1470562 RepID=UPI000680D656|nr:aminoglycoside phosphotransferase family protein [Aestuariivita boseongensis]